MHIVILDGGSTNPGDVSWAPLRALGSVTVYDSTKPEEIVERAKDAEAVILNRNVISREIMQKLPKLRFIGLLATGYNTVDVKAAGELGITVCNVPLYCVETVAQQAFALLLELCNHTEKISAATRGGDWDKAETMSHSTHPLFELYGKTLGIVGFGHIGQTVSKLGAALGMKILVYSRTKRELPERYQWAELDALFKNADVVSLHCPLTDETRGLVNAERLNLMKPTAFLINTARGAMGFTSVISTLTTNIRIRSREFAVLKSVGMTNRSLCRMLYSESIFCVLNALVPGVTLGIAIPFLINLSIRKAFPVLYHIPWAALFCGIFVLIGIVFFITRTEIHKLRDKSIIDEIRMDIV